MSAATLNDLGHTFIDAFNGTDSRYVRHSANAHTNTLKIVGIVVMVASALLAIATLATSLWLIAGLSLIPFLIGREIYVVSSNAKQIIDNAFLRGLSSCIGATIVRADFNSLTTKGTILMNCLAQQMPCLTTNLYQDYLNVRSPPNRFE